MKLNLDALIALTKTTHITVEKHPQQDLYIFGYSNGVVVKNIIWNELTKLCRGLIVDKQGNIVARPFEKFWTFRHYLSSDSALLSENRIQKIPDIPYRVYEKLDGSMAILYWIDGIPQMATQRSFVSPKAVRATAILHKKYTHTFDRMDQDFTYIFEAIYPETAIIIDYGEREDIVLIGVIEKSTGKSIPLPEIGFPVCGDLTEQFHNIDNLQDLCNMNFSNTEGLVIHYENDLRIKIKFPWYKEVSELKDKIINNSRAMALNQSKLAEKLGIPIPSLTTVDVWESLKNEDEKFVKIKAKLTLSHYVAGVEFWLEECAHQLQEAYHIQAENCEPNTAKCTIWDRIKPLAEEFVIDHSFNSEKNLDVIMWNWKDRYFNIFG